MSKKTEDPIWQMLQLIPMGIVIGLEDLKEIFSQDDKNNTKERID